MLSLRNIVVGRLAPAAALVFASLVGGCGGAAVADGSVRLSLGETKIVVLDNGAVVIDERRVAEIGDDGKLVTGGGTLVMWIRETNIRLRGGAAIPIRTDGEGALFLPEEPQERAGLVPMTRRLREDGTLASSAGSRGIPVSGASSARSRRVVLGVLLALDNNLLE